MHPPKFAPCSSMMNSHANSVHPVPSSMMSSLIDSPFIFNSPDIVDDKGALDLFNSHVDSGAHEQDPSNSMPSFLENDLTILESESITVASRQLRSTKTNEYNPNSSSIVGNSNKNVIHQPVVFNDHMNGGSISSNTKYTYSSSLDQSHPGNSLCNFPKKEAAEVEDAK
ncbi:DUF4211 domain-containing protein [Caerostris extrusa]|uniref:DUF4211 domain-containing protein n=1 Tax=Caerostris extrusa TaxID=172846 RepID=A0AAV4MJT1_CAEEX|nr:DUF4211 domain-containing protein [Caerostris extrusa]